MWGFVAPLLKKAVTLSPNKIAMPDVLEGAVQGVYTVWIITKDNEEIVASIATRVISYPRTASFAIEFVGGKEIKNWIDTALETFETVAKHNNCTHFEGYGRPAWIRYLGPRGFKPAFTTFEKELDNG